MQGIPFRLRLATSGLALAWLVVPRVHAARPDRTARCEAAKVLAAGKRVAGETSCHQKALAKGVTVSTTCLARVDKKFRAAAAKADGAGTCPGTADELATAADAYVATLLGSVAPTTTTVSSTSVSTTTVSTTTTLPTCSVPTCAIDADCGPGCGPCVATVCLGFTP